MQTLRVTVVSEEEEIMPNKIDNHKGYSGNYWAIVIGVKDPNVIPTPVRQFVRTAYRDAIRRQVRREHPGRTVCIIPQPISPIFEAGM